MTNDLWLWTLDLGPWTLDLGPWTFFPIARLIFQKPRKRMGFSQESDDGFGTEAGRRGPI